MNIQNLGPLSPAGREKAVKTMDRQRRTAEAVAEARELHFRRTVWSYRIKAGLTGHRKKTVFVRTPILLLDRLVTVPKRGRPSGKASPIVGVYQCRRCASSFNSDIGYAQHFYKRHLNDVQQLLREAKGQKARRVLPSVVVQRARRLLRQARRRMTQQVALPRGASQAIVAPAPEMEPEVTPPQFQGKVATGRFVCPIL